MRAYVPSGTWGFLAPACPAEARTRASTPRRNQRKLNHASAEPITNPVAQLQAWNTAATVPAATPRAIVSQAMRLSVARPPAAESWECLPAASEPSAFSIAVSGQTPQNFAHTGDKAEATEDQSKDGLGVQPAVEEETDQAGHKDCPH